MALAPCASLLPNLGRSQVALRQKITTQAIGDLAGIDSIVLLSCRGDGALRRGRRHGRRKCGVWLAVQGI
jgi:hypothetical protein